MARYRVKAFFMHEREKDAAETAAKQSLITSAEWTEGYVLGVVDERDIPKLAKQGLVITPVEKVEREAGPEVPPTEATPTSVRRGARTKRQRTGPQSVTSGPRPITLSIAGRPSVDKIESRDSEKAQFYVVRLHGPLTEGRRQILKAKSFHLI